MVLTIRASEQGRFLLESLAEWMIKQSELNQKVGLFTELIHVRFLAISDY